MSRLLPLLSLLVVCALSLAGCQGLSSALGMSPTATAPVFNGIGVVAMPGAWVDTQASPDQSGPVGADGTASQSSEQTQVVQIDPEAVAKGLAEVAAIVTPDGRAAKVLGLAEQAVEAGDMERAQKLVRAAKGFAEYEAGQKAPPAPQPAPVAPTESEAPAPSPEPSTGL